MDILDLVLEGSASSADSEARAKAREKSMARAQSMQNFRNAESEVNRLERLIELSGEEPPPEFTGSAFSKFFDTLATPAQAVTGVAAKLSDVDGYTGLSLVDSAKLGMERDINFGDILRERGWFAPEEDDSSLEKKAKSLGRGVTGFGLDVFFDPLSAITVGGGTALRAGGKALSKKKLLTKSGGLLDTGDILRRAEKSKFDELKSAIDSQKQSGLLTDDLYQDMLSEARLRASTEADRPFREASSLIQATKQSKRDGIGKLLKEADPERILERKKLIKDKLDLGDSVELGELFAAPAVRFGDPYTFFGGINKFVTGTEDVPLLTKGSAKLFDALSEPTYNAVRTIKDTTGLGLDIAEKVPVIGDITKIVRNAPRQFSRRAQAGGANQVVELQEDEWKRKILFADQAKRANVLFRKSDGGEFERDVLEEISTTLEAGLERGLNKKGGIASRPSDVVENVDDFNKAAVALKSKLNLREPGLGDEAERVLSKVRKDFEDMVRIEQKEGIVGAALDGYLPHVYKARTGVDQRLAIEDFRRKFDSFSDDQGVPGFSLERQYSTMRDAEIAGLSPIKDIKALYTMRKYSHERALMAKRFHERMSFQYGLPKSTLKRVAKLVQSQNEADAKAAQKFLRRRGVRLTADEIMSNADQVDDVAQVLNRAQINDAFFPENKHLDPVWGILYHPRTGNAISPEDYQAMKRNLVEGGPNKIAKQQDVIDKLGLKFTPEEQSTLEKLYANYSQARSRIPERMGEFFTERAGAIRAPNKFIKLIEGAAKRGEFDEVTKDMFTGVLPEPLVNAISESLDTRDALTRVAQAAARSGNKDPLNSAMYKIAQGYLSWVKWLKLGATMLFPSYHVRNFTSGQMQQGKAASILGDSLAPLKLYKTGKILQAMDKGDFARYITTNAGEQIPLRQLRDEMLSLGTKTNYSDTLELANGWQESMRALGVSELGLGIKQPSKLRKGIQSATDTVGGIHSKIENFGRGQLYLGLRQKGYSASEAARVTNQVMIDYGGGKTQFEKLWMNNIIFFYSFARGEAANTLTSMITRPGALSSQLHAVNGVAEIMRDPDAAPLPPDIEKRVETLRSQESLSRFIGYNEDGTPRVMRQIGIPVEDLSRFINLKTPNKLTARDILGATGESLVRTGQTLAASVNPVLRRPVEMIFNKSLFFDRALDDRTIRRVPNFAKAFTTLSSFDPKSIPASAMEKVDASVRTFLGAKEQADGTWIADPIALASLSFFPALDRIMSTAAFATKEGVPADEKWLRVISGVKTLDVDPRKSTVYDRRQRLRNFVEQELLPRNSAELRQRLDEE